MSHLIKIYAVARSAIFVSGTYRVSNEDKHLNESVTKKMPCTTCEFMSVFPVFSMEPR